MLKIVYGQPIREILSNQKLPSVCCEDKSQLLHCIAIWSSNFLTWCFDSLQPTMAKMLIRFEIVGCAEIDRKVSRAIKVAPNATLYAIGSRSLEKSSNFAAANGFPPNIKVYGSYKAVPQMLTLYTCYF